MPVIDRDEARYAQATVQMVESGDYLNIKFQDRARNKKPAGIYWMQAASVKTFTDPSERKIWAHRIPSVLGALLAVLATYWGGIVVLGRRGAFIAAAILSVSALFVFEAHIAKTDAVLCGFSALVMASLLRLRTAPARHLPLVFWGALGAAIMIKGPIVPGVVVLTLIGLIVWERDFSWMKSLISWPGILLCGLIVVPWMIAIGIATNGAFFVDSFGGDLAPKLVGGQEKHGAPPGYYLATLPVLFWPGCLFLLSGLVFAFRAARNQREARLSGAMRLLLTWTIPFWSLLEIVPTKLPNYLLPTYPALALMSAAAIMAMMSVDSFRLTRRIGAIIFFVVSIGLITVVLSAEALYSSRGITAFLVCTAVIAGVFIVAGSVWKSRIERGLIAAGLCAAVLTPLTYQIIMPRLETIQVSHQIEAAFDKANIAVPRLGGAQVYSPQFTEPSLVYRLGTNILLGDKTDTALQGTLRNGDIVLFDMASKDAKVKATALKVKMQSQDICFNTIEPVTGINYSRGDVVDIQIMQASACDPEVSPASESRPER
jgi:4-amino-4-deoxy-L-arabinose transferase-like glycosyltransferase